MIILRNVNDDVGDPDRGSFQVYRTNLRPGEWGYDHKDNFLLKLDMDEPRWNRNDPNAKAVIGVKGLKIVSIDVTTGEPTTIKDFGEKPTEDFWDYREIGQEIKEGDKTVFLSLGEIIKRYPHRYSITMKDEGESSYDGNWWAFVLREYIEPPEVEHVIDRSWCIFCWDRVNNKVVGLRELSLEQKEIDWVGMSPKGTWVLIAGKDYNAEPLKGLKIASREDRNLKDLYPIAPKAKHADVGLYIDRTAPGDKVREAVVVQNESAESPDVAALHDYIDLLRLPAEHEVEIPKPIHLVRLFYKWDEHLVLDPNSLNIFTGVHISCNANGYAVVSTYNDPGIKEKNWLERSIILVKLDLQALEAFYLAKTHNTTAVWADEHGNRQSAYWDETHAAITNDGTSVVWAANFDPAPPVSAKEYVMQLDLKASS
jgi:hypothetical protein